MKHIKQWLKTKDELQTAEEKAVEIYEFQHSPDEAILSAWAQHFREQYCSKEELESAIEGTGHSKQSFLEQLVFPHPTTKPGPSVRAGDFAEVMVADYLEFVKKYWVPRVRMDNKATPNESVKGCDIIAFKITSRLSTDELAIFETKATLSNRYKSNRLQDAVDDSVKDQLRKAESLFYIKRQLSRKGRAAEALRVERFQDPEDKPYRETSGAIAIVSTPVFSETPIQETISGDHPLGAHLRLVVIHGVDLMTLAHELYARAVREA